MPTSLTVDQHLGALESAGAGLLEFATAAGPDAPVPTCPEWVVADLVAHQAKVHRWAAANVRGEDTGAVPNDDEIRALDDPAGFYRDGLAGLVAALRAAPADLEAMTFLNDAPPPRAFWARRQAHETTIHQVDALAAQRGRVPTAAEVEAAGLGGDLAADGIDELLRGFFTRGRSKLHDGTPFTVAITATDAGRRWTLQVDERLTVTDGDDEAAATLTGTAVQLYLGLWNRGDEITVSGDRDVLDRWRAVQQVRWR